MFSTTEECKRGFKDSIWFSEDKRKTLAEFENEWKLRKSDEIYLWAMKRSIVELPEFWKKVGQIIADDKDLKKVKFNTAVYGNEPDMFEESVLKQIPSHIEIHFRDWKKDEDGGVEELSKWMQKYHVTCFRNSNTSIVNEIVKARSLKAVYFRNMSSVEKLDPLFRQENKLHAVGIDFMKHVIVKEEVITKWLQAVKERRLFPGGIHIAYGLAETFIMKEDCEELNNRKRDEEWCLRWKLDKLINQIKMSELVDETEYFCYLTKMDLTNRLCVEVDELDKILAFGKEEECLVVLKKEKETRVCFTKLRKFPLGLVD